jgi:predicted enzyme related to lactoylglutathione lyase
MYRVEDVDAAIAFYRDVMGLRPIWRVGEMAGLELPETPGTEVVVHTDPNIPELDVNYKVENVLDAVQQLQVAGCTIVAGPFPIAIGNCAVVRDPFGHSLTLLDSTKGPRERNLTAFG